MNEVTAIARKILVTAREVLSDPDRWHKGDMMAMGPKGIKFCSLGVVHDSAQKQAWGFEPVFSVLDQTLMACLDPKWQGKVAQFNDHPRTTHADVLAFFDRCIAYVGEVPETKVDLDPKPALPQVWETLMIQMPASIQWTAFDGEKPVVDLSGANPAFIQTVEDAKPFTATFDEFAEAHAETPEPVKELVPA